MTVAMTTAPNVTGSCHRPYQLDGFALFLWLPGDCPGLTDLWFYGPQRSLLKLDHTLAEVPEKYRVRNGAPEPCASERAALRGRHGAVSLERCLRGGTLHSTPRLQHTIHACSLGRVEERRCLEARENRLVPRLTGNRNRASIFAIVAFSNGKPDSTFPKNALVEVCRAAAHKIVFGLATTALCCRIPATR